MAEKTPLYMDINSVYSGDEMGLPYRDIMSEGIVGAGDFLVSAGAGNTVNIAAGACWVLGDTDTVNQPVYRVINDAVVNKGITPDPSNPRYVRMVAQITDATFSGATRAMVITAIHGTPAGSPAVPALPASALDLCTILVPAAAASSAAYTLTDTRVRARVGGGSAQSSAMALSSRGATGSQVVATATYTILTWGGTSRFDTAGMVAAAGANTDLKCVTAGTYLVWATAWQTAGGPGGIKQMSILKNGTQFGPEWTAGAGDGNVGSGTQTVPNPVVLAVNDILTAKLYQDSGGNVTIGDGEFVALRIA